MQAKDSTIQFSPVKKKLAYEVIYEYVKDLIISGTLAAGDKLMSEREMMTKFGYSHPTIREAMSMLEKDGLIKINPGRNAVVVELTLDRFKHHLEVMMMLREVTPIDLLNYRAAISIEVAGWAAVKRQPADIELLSNICAQMEQAYQDADRIVDLDVEFHSALNHCAYNLLASLFSDTLGSIMKQHLNQLFHNLPKIRQRESITEIIKSHQATLQAVIDQDQARTRELVKIHMDDYYNFASQAMPFIQPPNETDNYVTIKASQAIYEQIYAKIISGELGTGDRLPSERQLMDMFERSRPSIREALRMLESEGYINVFPGSKGAVVNKISTEIIERPLGNIMLQGKVSDADLLEFRTINDITCLTWAASNRTETDIEVLSQIIACMKENINNVRIFFEYDVEFHKAIARSSQNSIAYIISRVLINLVFDRNMAAVEKYKLQDLQANMQMILSQHESLLQVIINKQQDKAAESVLSHIKGFEKMMKK